MAVWRQTESYRDGRGNVGHVAYFVEGADAGEAHDNALALHTLIVALTDAAFAGAKGPYYADPQLAYGANDAPNSFESAEDKLMLAGKTVLNRNWRMEIPQPKPALFLADGETADFANAALAAFIAAAVAADGTGMCDKGGDELHIIYGGARKRRPTQRRFSLITKNPQLTGPGL